MSTWFVYGPMLPKCYKKLANKHFTLFSTFSLSVRKLFWFVCVWKCWEWRMTFTLIYKFSCCVCMYIFYLFLQYLTDFIKFIFLESTWKCPGLEWKKIRKNPDYGNKTRFLWLMLCFLWKVVWVLFVTFRSSQMFLTNVKRGTILATRCLTIIVDYWAQISHSGA